MSLTRSDYEQVAAQYGVETAALMAVADVESSGVAFLPDGRLKILFEGHVFWSELKRRGIDPVEVGKRLPTICYPRWTREHYRGGAKEYDRLGQACHVHEEAARCSASWGMFQMMGFNHRAAGYPDVFAMVRAYADGREPEQLRSVCEWMTSNGLIKRLAAKDWAGFARGYNGPGQVQTYGAKLQAAYQRRAHEPKSILLRRAVYVNDEQLPASSVAEAGGRIFVWVREFARVGAQVNFDLVTNRVNITSKPEVG